jgi:16S rRNA (cytidine1402-2'-O)-methyltransferase
VVATPIGNLDDLTPRALRVLSQADLIAAEDTRHSAKLLKHYAIRTPTLSLHEHNERVQVPRLIEALRAGKSIALISDAGTPLVSDPGFHFVRAARDAGVQVVPVPGPCAAITALSVAGLPTDRFVFEGFPPARPQPRRAAFEAVATETRTLVYYESPHRIVDSLGDMASAFGDDRGAAVARELTKAFETFREGTLAQLRARIAGDPNEQRGEFVVLVHGASPAPAGELERERILKVLLTELSVKQAATLAAKITGAPRNELYRQALALAEPPSDRRE